MTMSRDCACVHHTKERILTDVGHDARIPRAALQSRRAHLQRRAGALHPCLFEFEMVSTSLYADNIILKRYLAGARARSRYATGV